ncbi:hypothetical protein [Streptomyces sp. NPDC059909]|uniref:hypothetical protein n=1 Tax=Streptomyces sp. NPDC059909 TaxID=3346998 RepID=UPI00364CF603
MASIRADAPAIAVGISTGTFSVAGSQSPPGHQALAIANIVAGWIVITTRRRHVRVYEVAGTKPDSSNAPTHRIRMTDFPVRRVRAAADGR